MIFTNNLGVFSSIQAVWEEYPAGGVLGDYVQVSGQIYGWNVTQRQWTLPDASTSRIAKVVDGDLHVNNDVTVGGILRARVVRGRNAFAGLFASSAALNAACSNPEVGMWAAVVIADRTGVDENALGEVYICETAGTWTDAGFTCDGPDLIEQLQSESETREEADQNLQESINGVAGDLSDEAQARQDGDSALSDRITENDFAVITDAEMDEVLA